MHWNKNTQKVIKKRCCLVDLYLLTFCWPLLRTHFLSIIQKKLHPIHPWKSVERINFLHIRSKKNHPFVSAPMLWSESNPLADWAGWGCKSYTVAWMSCWKLGSMASKRVITYNLLIIGVSWVYPSSHNHGSVENGCSWKVTTLGGIHFCLSWLWKERHSLKPTASRTPP